MMTHLEFDDYLGPPGAPDIFDARDFFHFIPSDRSQPAKASPIRAVLVDSPVYSPKDSYGCRGLVQSLLTDDNLEDSVFGDHSDSPPFCMTNDSTSTCFCGDQHLDMDNNHGSFVIRSISSWYIQWTEPGANSSICLHGCDTNGKVHWSSSPIVKRLSNTHVVSATGTHYHLLGPLNISGISSSQSFHATVIRKFRHGFPENWKQVLSEWVGLCHTLLEAFPDHTSDPDIGSDLFPVSESRSYFYSDSSDPEPYESFSSSHSFHDFSFDKSEALLGSSKGYRSAADLPSHHGHTHHSSKSRGSRSSESTSSGRRSSHSYSYRDDSNEDGRDPSGMGSLQRRLSCSSESSKSRHRHGSDISSQSVSGLVRTAAIQKASKHLGKDYERRADDIISRISLDPEASLFNKHSHSPKRQRQHQSGSSIDSESKKSRKARQGVIGCCAASSCSRTANQRCTHLFCKQCCLQSGNRCEEHSSHLPPKDIAILPVDIKPPPPSTIIHRQGCQGSAKCTNKLNKKCPNKLCRDCCSNRDPPCRVHAAPS